MKDDFAICANISNIHQGIENTGKTREPASWSNFISEQLAEEDDDGG